MNADIMNELLPIAISLSLLTIFLAYLIIKTPASFKVKFLGIPMLLLSAIISVNTLDDLLGKAVWGPPETKFSLIGYYTNGAEAKIPTIEVWTFLPDGNTKLYKFPYSDDLLKKLQDAMLRKQRGDMLIGKWTDKKADGDEDDMGSMEFELVTPSQAIPK